MNIICTILFYVCSSHAQTPLNDISGTNTIYSASEVDYRIESRVPTNRMITIGSQVGSLQTNLVFASTGTGVTEPTVTNIAQAVASAYVPTNSAEYTTTVSNATVALKVNEFGGLAVGQYSSATGYQSFSFGDSEASGNDSFGFSGYATGANSVAFQGGQASEQLSFAIGLLAYATNRQAFVYNGSSSPSVYGSHGTGTFNINARNGASGVYIGETNLQSYLDRRVEKSNGTATNLSVFSSLTLLDKTITWNSSRQTFDVPLFGGVVGQLFQENLMLVRNQTGANIGNGKIVCSAGSVGDNSAIRKASSSDASCAWGVLGMVTQDAGIDHGSDGLICTGGEVNNLPLPTSVYQPSNTLWLATDGNYTNVEPQNVAVKYQIGTVLRAHATEGRIQFNPQFIPSPETLGALPTSHNTDETAHPGLRSIVKPIVFGTNVVRVVSTQSVYVATVTSPCVITQDVSALTLATNQTAFWTTRINVTDWGATNGITFATNIVAYAGDFTVTGCYDFACSLLCDGRIEMRQTFPTVYPWSSFPAYFPNTNTPDQPRYWNEVIRAAFTNNFAMLCCFYEFSSPCILRFNTYNYTLNGTTNPITVKLGMGRASLLPETNASSVSTNLFLSDGNLGGYGTYSLYVDPLPKVSPAYASPYIQFVNPYPGPRAIIYKFSIKQANENEIRAYNNGWRPR